MSLLETKATQLETVQEKKVPDGQARMNHEILVITSQDLYEFQGLGGIRGKTGIAEKITDFVQQGRQSLLSNLPDQMKMT